MYWSEPKSYNKPFELMHSWDLGFRGQWSGYRNSFCQSRLLTVTLWPCSLMFNVQVMILAGSSGFFNSAYMSVDRCCLYIIIHYGTSQRLGNKVSTYGGRTDPDFFKEIDTYAYNKNHTKSPYVCLGCIKIVHMGDGSLSSSLIENEWVGSLVLIISL